MGQGHDRPAVAAGAIAPAAGPSGTTGGALQPRGNAFAQDQLAAASVITMPEVVIEGDPHAGEEIDDARVQEWIDECYANAAFTEEPSRTNGAWAHALALRRDSPQDVNLAAAEHYLYARYTGLQDGPLGAAATGLMAAGYDLVKAGAFAFGVEDWLSTDGTTPSRPTFGSTRWGLQGAADGLDGE